MKRRAAVIGLAAVAGLAAGGGTAVWHRRSDAPVGGAEGEPDLWRSTFESPAGPPMAMTRFAGRPLLLNFWATWCVPCVTEMPLLDAFASRQPAHGFQVLALAIDKGEAVRQFTSARAIKMNVALAGADGLDLSRSLGNSVGALPFSVAFGSNGKASERRLGPLTEAILDGWAATVR